MDIYLTEQEQRLINNLEITVDAVNSCLSDIDRYNNNLANGFEEENGKLNYDIKITNTLMATVTKVIMGVG